MAVAEAIDNTLDQALKEVFARIRDVSLRDGVQSWDSNRWKIEDITNIARQLNELANTAKDHGFMLNPVEIWGGGQFAQPAKFLHEDPFVNLEEIHKAAPDITLQCLYRGMQGFAFEPIAPEIQNAAIEASADRGIQVFRIFDMMNDIRNVTPGIEAVKAYQKKHPDKGVKIEGAVSYVSEPEGKRAWEIAEYAEYAVKLAKLGCDAIAIKDYAGVADDEIHRLVPAMRKALDDNGHSHIPLNVHSHGQKPEILNTALHNGASIVDVAIGELAGGPSHTNMRDMIHLLMQEKGFDREAVNAHPVMQKLTEVESGISHIVHRRDMPGKDAQGNATFRNFDDSRALLKKLKPEDIQKYRMAAGAFSDITSTIEQNYENLAKEWTRKQIRNFPESPEALFRMVLENAPPLWEKAGRPNTVTPGAKIILQQALKKTLNDISGKPETIEIYTEAYNNIVTGRFGRNQGMEKGVGDQKFCDALLIFNALKVFNEAKKAGKVGVQHLAGILSLSGFGTDAETLKRSDNMFNLKDPLLEMILTSIDSDRMQNFVYAINHTAIPDEVKNRMLAELKPGRAPEPVSGLQEGEKIVEKLGDTIEGIRAAGGNLSNDTTLPLLAMLLRNPSENKPDIVFENMVNNIAGNPVKAVNDNELPPRQEEARRAR